MTGMAPTTPFSLCVFCGSRSGTCEAYAAEARQVGREVGRRGWRLVYGGGGIGLMGVVADAALEAGAEVVGVIPGSLVSREVEHRGLSELIVVDTMHQRKQAMAERAHAFIALPGGIGTLEELFEVWTWRHLGLHDQPIGVLNTAGHYDALLAFMQSTLAAGFVSQETLAMLAVGDEPTLLLDRLAALALQSRGVDDYGRT